MSNLLELHASADQKQRKIDNPMEQNFSIRSYGRSELASLYLPNTSQKSAWNTFRYVWAARNPRLRLLLKKVGSRRCFTPQEVRIIVEELGEP